MNEQQVMNHIRNLLNYFSHLTTSTQRAFPSDICVFVLLMVGIDGYNRRIQFYVYVSYHPAYVYAHIYDRRSPKKTLVMTGIRTLNSSQSRLRTAWCKCFVCIGQKLTRGRRETHHVREKSKLIEKIEKYFILLMNRVMNM